MANNKKDKNHTVNKIEKRDTPTRKKQPGKYHEKFKVGGTFEEIIKKLVTPKE